MCGLVVEFGWKSVFVIQVELFKLARVGSRQVRSNLLFHKRKRTEGESIESGIKKL